MSNSTILCLLVPFMQIKEIKAFFKILKYIAWSVWPSKYVGEARKKYL